MNARSIKSTASQALTMGHYEPYSYNLAPPRSFVYRSAESSNHSPHHLQRRDDPRPTALHPAVNNDPRLSFSLLVAMVHE